MKQVKSSRSLYEEIPSPIIWDILSRLPTKACLSCKLVCKEWYAIITNPQFVDSRRSYYSSVLLYGRFYDGGSDYLLLDLDKHAKFDKSIVNVNAMVRFKSPFENLLLGFGSECNGYILLKSKKGNHYVVCNLLTGQYVIVENTSKPYYAVKSERLGYYSVTNQFKVLRILKRRYRSSYIAEIQTLGTNEWRTLHDPPQYDMSWSNAVFLKDSIHSVEENCISSFHFGNEEFSRIPCPDEVQLIDGVSLHIYDSCLCLGSICFPCYKYEIWIMKNYGVKDSWVKQFVLGLPHMPLVQLDNEEVLVSKVFKDSFRGLALLNTKSGLCEKITVLGVSTFKFWTFDPKFSKL